MAEDPPPPQDPKLVSLTERLAKYSQTQEKPDTQRAKAAGWQMATELMIIPCVGLGVGYGLDKLLESSPVFLLIFFIFGLAGAVMRVIRIGLKMTETEDKDKT